MDTLISVAPLQGDYLEHHQIKGASWGVFRGPPYPLARGKSGGKPKIKKVEKSAINRVERQVDSGVSGAAAKKEALRKYVIEHPNKLYKNKDMFSKEELEDIMKEIDFDRKLKDVKRNEFKRFVDTAKDVAALTISIKNIADSSVGIYNKTQEIAGILSKSKNSSDDKSETAKSEKDSKSDKSEKKPEKSDGKKSDKTESKPEDKAESKKEKSNDKKFDDNTNKDIKIKDDVPNSSSNDRYSDNKDTSDTYKEPSNEDKRRRNKKGISFAHSDEFDSYISSILKGNPSFAHSDKGGPGWLDEL